MTDFIAVIPARFASVRLPGKPLREINGRPMIEHVYRRARESAARDVVIATDDARIADAAKRFGAAACMTDTRHRSGTDRIAEVAEIMGWADDQVVVNLQGDEPTMPAALIDQCAQLLDDPTADIGTLASPLESAAHFDDPNIVKVILDDASNAIYFSRAAIPFARAREQRDLARTLALHHHGIYAYRCGILRRFVSAGPTQLEVCEQLEQLRALALGMTIRVDRPSMRPGAGVDTEQDLLAVSRELADPNA